ncbi:Molybdenum transport system permease protein modB, partial [Dysosmobacter welbionis]
HLNGPAHLTPALLPDAALHKRGRILWGIGAGKHVPQVGGDLCIVRVPGDGGSICLPPGPQGKVRHDSLLSEQFEHIIECHYQHEAHQGHKAHGVYRHLILLRDLLSEQLHGDLINDEEEDLAAVQSRDGQHVHHCQVHRQHGAEVEDVLHRGGNGLRRGAHLGDSGDDAHRAAEIVHARLTGHQHLQAQPHDPHKVDGVQPAGLQDRPEIGLLNLVSCDIDAVALIGLPLRAGVGAPCDVVQLHLLAVPQDHQIHGLALVQAHQQGHVTVQVHPLPIDGIKNISGLDSLAVPLLKLRRGPGGRRDQKSLGTAIHRQNDEEPRQEIHKGAGGKNHHLFPEALTAQRPLVARVLILPLHSAEAADGQQPEGILGLLRLLVPDQRPHADGKLVDPHAAELGGQEVAQLVDGDQYAENQNGRQDIHNGHAKTPVKKLASSPVQHRLPRRLVRRQNVLQRRFLLRRHSCPGLRHQAGNVVEADPARQEQAHRLLIGAVQNSAGGAALSRRRLCQLQTWKCIPVRLGEGQGRAGQQVQRLRRTFHPFGVCHGISNGQAHIRCAQLGQDRPVPVLHQGVDDALPVDHHRHLVQRQTVEAHGLDDLQPLVHQRGAVYGDLG